MIGHPSGGEPLMMDVRQSGSGPLTRKCDLYRRYWQAGDEQARTGVFPRVLWVVPDQSRADVLGDVVARQPADGRPLFAVALFTKAIDRLVQGAGL